MLWRPSDCSVPANQSVNGTTTRTLEPISSSIGSFFVLPLFGSSSGSFTDIRLEQNEAQRKQCHWASLENKTALSTMIPKLSVEVAYALRSTFGHED